jgi:type II secretory pathway pseudopilin PulG
MQRRAGFALVTSLLVMLVIAALGVGGVFLSNMNLRIAENTRTQAMARFNAESGMDQMYTILAASVLAETQAVLPANFDAVNDLVAAWDTTDGWELVRYQRQAGSGRNGADQAELRVRGTAPRNAQHVVDAVVEAVATPAQTGDGYSIFGEGIVSLQNIDLAGAGTFDIPFHAGGNIDLRAATVVEGNSMIFAGSSCRWGAPPRSCTAGDPPEVDAPDFVELRQAVIDAQDPDDYAACAANPQSGNVTINNVSGGLVCLAPGANATVIGNVDDLTIIGDDSTTVNLDARTGDPTDDEVRGVTVVSRTITFGSGAAFYGENTIIAIDDITFGKNVVSNDGNARTFIVTEGNFELQGTGATDIYASFWVGGTFAWRGTPNNFRGTIVSVGEIFGAGCGAFCNIRPPDDLINEFVPGGDGSGAAGWGLWVLSRR